MESLFFLNSLLCRNTCFGVIINFDEGTALKGGAAKAESATPCCVIFEVFFLFSFFTLLCTSLYAHIYRRKKEKKKTFFFWAFEFSYVCHILQSNDETTTKNQLQLLIFDWLFFFFFLSFLWLVRGRVAALQSVDVFDAVRNVFHSPLWVDSC